jgi:5-methylthioadenosine/S-adenosylhomocysteine deaminase
MTRIFASDWVLPISSSPINDGAIAVEDDLLVAIDKRRLLVEKFPDAEIRDFGPAAIIPGLVNCHTHLELTAMRGFLDAVEDNFFSWLRKLTVARLERMTEQDLLDSATWGACEAARAGITSLGDASDSALTSMLAVTQVGLRATVFQESFGPDPQLASENFSKLQQKIARLRELETALVRAGVSPHAPYTVCSTQLKSIAEFAAAEDLPLMMHAAESRAEELLMREGKGAFAESLRKRNIEWSTPGASTIQYLAQCDILETKPLLAHCVTVDDVDLQLIKESDARVAHCPRSNAKLGHGRAPLTRFIETGVKAGLGSDSVASNNSCDVLSEARAAILGARSNASSGNGLWLTANDGLYLATLGGARALGYEGVVGELKPGLHADFTVVGMNGAHQIPSYDTTGTLIFSSSGHDVLLTAVAGRIIYDDGRIAHIDEDRLRARIIEIAHKL